MVGKRVLVTGGTNGIGRQAALELARLGAEVVIVGRDPQKTDRVVGELRSAAPGATITSMLADLSSMASVRKLAADFLARHERLDVLVNNAGGFNRKRELTVDGFERTLAINHLAYHLLATLLTPALARAGGARVVNVSSDAHRMGRLNFEDLQAERLYNEWMQYGRSKLCNIYFTRELARRLADQGITANSLHPGFVASDFLAKGGLWSFFKPVAYLFAIDVERGARTTVYLASSPEVAGVTGKYFYKCKAVSPRKFAEDDAAAARLWDETEKLLARAP